MLNRGLEPSYIQQSLREIIALGEEGRRDAWLLTFQTRNVRVEYKDFHATAVQEGVVQLSGWSPSILAALQTGVTVQRPYDALRTVLDDPQYDHVRERLKEFGG